MDNRVPKELRLLILGTGAIGTYIGGSLAIAGVPVVFLDKPDVVDEIRQRGIRLNISGSERIIDSPNLACSIGEALSMDHFDAAIFALKSYDTKSALEELQAHSSDLPPLICLQNGVENEPVLESVLGEGRVIAGTVTSAINRRAAGDIILERFRGVGLYAGHPLSTDLLRAMDKARLNPHFFPNASDMKWSKMLTNLIANATSAILEMSPAEIYNHPGIYQLEIAQLRETLTVMGSLGIRPVDLPSTPVRLLAFIVRRLPLWISHPLLRRVVGSGRGEKMPSFYIDLHSGRGKSEVDYLNGAVVRFGKRLDIPTPANQLLTRILLAMTRGEIDRNAFARQPEKLITVYQDLTTP